MTKNTIGGKGHKRAKKQVVDVKNIPLKNSEEETDYAIVTAVLGNGRMRVMCLGDRKDRLGHIRGTLYKKTWIAKDDVVLISIRDFQNDRCDILFKYSGDEIRTLIKTGEIDKDYNSNSNNSDNKDEDDLIFAEDDQQIQEIPYNKNETESSLDSLDIDEI